MKVEPRTLKGFRDFLPKDARKRQYVIDILKSVFESYGFEPLETPALEYEEVLLGKYGDEGDKLMYRFEDNGKRKVALRYDQTVPLARVVAQYQNDLPMPFKRYQIQNVWRAENTQKGRFREFLQCDADIVGTSSPLADSEIITVAVKSLQKLKFKNFKILINDRDVANQLIELGFIKKEELPTVFQSLDKYKKIGEAGVVDDLKTKGFSEDKAKAIVSNAKLMKENQRLLDIFKYLRSQDINYDFTPTLARGLNYYTGLIFEAEIEGYDAGSVAGGGRYDDLIGMFAERQFPAVGFAFGFDRIIEAMEQFDLFPKELSVVKILVTVLNNKEESIKIYKKLRDENISCEIYLNEDALLEKQLKYADRKTIPHVLIVKEDTLELKDMNKREQKNLSFGEILKILK